MTKAQKCGICSHRLPSLKPSQHAMFFVPAKTVSTHKANLMRKLRIENNADLIRYAAMQNLTTEVRKTAAW